MKRYITNQQGFTIVETLLVIITLTLLVFTGYYIWHGQQKTKPVSSSSSKVSQPVATAPAKPQDKQGQLQQTLFELCSQNDAAAIRAMFQNQSAQTVDTDNFKISGDYAIVNVHCTLKQNIDYQLNTEFFKFTNNKWLSLVNAPTSVSCDYLTKQGFPDDLKAPYCQNPGQFE